MKDFPDWKKIADDLVEQLLWCGGSKDFSPGGIAQNGWRRGPKMAVARYDAAVRATRKQGGSKNE